LHVTLKERIAYPLLLRMVLSRAGEIPRLGRDADLIEERAGRRREKACKGSAKRRSVSAVT
jgi:hypothetical protein